MHSLQHKKKQLSKYFLFEREKCLEGLKSADIRNIICFNSLKIFKMKPSRNFSHCSKCSCLFSLYFFRIFLVVYENGKAKKADYRKFRIQSVKGPNDYASMYEVLTRRFVHAKKESEELLKKNMDFKFGSFTRYPDLILMDGGR